MITWSTYYELRNYSKYNFVEKFLPSKENAKAWSIMSIFQSSAYMIGPIIAVYFISKNLKSPLFASLLITSFATISFLLFQILYKKKGEIDRNSERNRSLFEDVKITHILARRVWPLVMFSFALTLLDVSFWTIGVLYSEKLRVQNPIGGMFITMYGLPAILTAMIAPKIYGRLGKKRTAFVIGILSGCALISLALFKDVYVILGTVFVIAMLSGISFILTYATFEDFITRLDGTENNMVSIGQISQNVAYVIGPIFFGLISKDGNFGHSFIAAGEILILFSILALAVVPRKIKMPHKEIARIVEKVLDEI